MKEDQDAFRRHQLLFGKLVEQAQSKPETIHRQALRPSLTISRTTGSRAVSIAKQLSEFLTDHDPTAEHGWTIYDENLVDTIIQDHKLPYEIRSFMPEDHVGPIRNYIEKLTIGTDDRRVFECTVDTIRKLGHLGYTIIVGRGANLINRDLPNSYHIRFVGSEAVRLKHTATYYQLSETEAQEKMNTQDLGRARFVNAHFGCDVDDPLIYHLVINTDLHSDQDVVRLVGKQFLHWTEQQRHR